MRTDGLSAPKINGKDIGDAIEKGVDSTISSGSTSTNLPTSAAVETRITGAISEKADKVSSPTSGDFAGLDYNGNLTDSGKSASDFVASDQGSGNAGKILGIGNDGIVVPVTNSGGGSAVFSLSLTLLSSGWSNATPPTQTLTASGVTSSDTSVIVSLSPSATAEQIDAAGTARIMCTAQGTDSITMTALNSAPSIDIPLSVVVAVEEPASASGVEF